MERFVDALLRAGQPNPFVDELDRLTARLAPFGFRNSLAQLALKFTVPGVPDLYQGSEQWTFSLVDPDNRRPVDFAQLAAQLEALRKIGRHGVPDEAQWRELWRSAADGRIKHFLTWRLLHLRGSLAALFQSGGYIPLAVRGEAADHAVAFARHHEGEVIVVVAARLTYTLCAGDEARWSPSLWRDTQLDLDGDLVSRVARWRNWLTGEEIDTPRTGEATLALDGVFAQAHGLPFVVLHGRTP
jgi:(1->4)-alpha-D-glucan 1-alpha-D-glucosylmutase